MHGLGCLRQLCLGPGLTAVGAGGSVYDLCCHQKRHGSLGSVLPLTGKGKEATIAVVLMTADAQLRKRDTGGFCDNPDLYSNPTPPQQLAAGKGIH